MPLNSINDVKIKTKYSQITQSANNQQTNFRNILDSIIPEFIKPDTTNILTIFSDFYHDDTTVTPKVLYNDFVYFQKNAKIKKYNFIALWSDDQSAKRKIAQNVLIRDFQIHLDGIINTDYVFVDRYNDDNYYNRDSTIRNLEFLTLFKVNNTKTGKNKYVSFNSSISNEFNFEEGKAIIVLDEKYKNSHFYWRIKEIFNSENHFKEYRKIENDKESTYFLNVMDDVNEHPFLYYNNNLSKNVRYFHRPFFENRCDSMLEIALRIDGTYNYDKYELAICSIDDSSYYYTEYDIDLKRNNINPEQKKILHIVLNFICFLLITIFFAGEYLFYQLLNDKIKLKYNRLPRLIWSFGIILLIAVLVVLFCFVFSARYFFWPLIVLISIIIMIFVKIRYLWLLMPEYKRKLIIDRISSTIKTYWDNIKANTKKIKETIHNMALKITN